MNSKQLLTQFLFGLTIPQQYVCVSLETLTQPLRSFITAHEEQQSSFINPVFVGYKPVVWATAETLTLPQADEYCLHFHNEDVFFDPISLWKGFPADNRSVAKMQIEVLPLKFEAFPEVRLFQGTRGSHSFIHPLHTIANALREKLVKSPPGNVDLPGDLHDMVRIAYAIPRIISLISVTDGTRMNLFPTDLHGQLNKDYYISSLRIGGKAQRQVQQYKKIVISQITSDQFEEVYNLGKNHMKDLTGADSFKLSTMRSEKFQIPLPAGVLRYMEVEVVQFIDVGIHRIFLYKVENRKQVAEGNTLSHIHQYYAQWRQSHGISTEFFLRRS
ncbi:MAG TPA: hypothetical protein VGD65_03000 [Chryseosolibacter sp.]